MPNEDTSLEEYWDDLRRKPEPKPSLTPEKLVQMISSVAHMVGPLPPEMEFVRGPMADIQPEEGQGAASPLAFTPGESPLLTIHGEGGRMLVEIHDDGSLEFGEGYNPSEAARIFWEAIAQQRPRG